jgi:hypothetical protein
MRIPRRFGVFDFVLDGGLAGIVSFESYVLNQWRGKGMVAQSQL